MDWGSVCSQHGSGGTSRAQRPESVSEKGPQGLPEGGRAGQEMGHGHPHGGQSAAQLLLQVREEGALGDRGQWPPRHLGPGPFLAFNDCAHLSCLLSSIHKHSEHYTIARLIGIGVPPRLYYNNTEKGNFIHLCYC